MRKSIFLTGIAVLWGLGLILLVTSESSSTAHADRVPYSLGDVFAGVGNGRVKHFDSSGTLLETLDTTTGSQHVAGMAFDGKGNLFVTNFTSNSMSKFDKAGTLVGGFGGQFDTAPESVVFDKNGNVYVGQADGLRQVRKLDAAGKLLATYSPATDGRGTDWIDLAADQCTLFYTSEGRHVKRFDVCSNNQLPDFVELSAGTEAFALRIRPNGEVLVATHEEVHRLSSSGAVLQSYPKPPTEKSTLFALNLDPNGTSFWTGGIESGNVYKINMADGTVERSFNVGILSTQLAGLAVYGEIVVAQPTPPASLPDTGGNRALSWQVAFVGGLALWSLGLILLRRKEAMYRG